MSGTSDGERDGGGTDGREGEGGDDCLVVGGEENSLAMVAEGKNGMKEVRGRDVLTRGAVVAVMAAMSTIQGNNSSVEESAGEGKAKGRSVMGQRQGTQVFGRRRDRRIGTLSRRRNQGCERKVGTGGLPTDDELPPVSGVNGEAFGGNSRIDDSGGGGG